jgi:hypothetical protein
MKCNYQKINNSKGIGLLEVMVSIGLLGGVAVLVMNLGKQGSDIQSRSLSGKDEVEMLSVARTILSQAKNCAESLKLGVARTPIQVKKINNDQADNGEGVETEIFQTDYNGIPHKVLSKDGTESSFGKVNITSIKLVLNNGVGFNYPASSLHSDTGIIRISYTVPRGTKKLDKRSDFIINLSMNTNGGNTTMLNCSKDSGLFTSKAAAVSGLSSSGYVNNWDQTFSYNCPGQKALCGEQSYHNNGTEDRRHSFKCCDVKVDNQILNRKSCTSSGQVNEFDRLLNFSCPKNSLAVGHWSSHDNGTEDRIYDFKCCDYGSASQQVKTENCELLPNGAWANNWDQPVNFTCPAGKVKIGELSVHHNGTEDRIYRFKCCSVVVEELN